MNFDCLQTGNRVDSATRCQGFALPVSSLLQILHDKVYDEVLQRLVKAYGQVKVGDPLERKLSLYFQDFYLRPVFASGYYFCQLPVRPSLCVVHCVSSLSLSAW